MGIIRKTKSVKTLLYVFEQTEEALSITYLIERLKNEMNKTTVYRILERLKDEGILHSFTDKYRLQWFAKCDGCSSSHHRDLHPHFQCEVCGKTECMNIDIPIPDVPNYKIDSAELLFIGKCENCFKH